MSHRPPVIVGLCGSLRPGSHTRAALLVALAAAEKDGALVRLVDPVQVALPFCDGAGNAGDAAVEELKQLVADCDGLILASPEYHGSYSGVLKNMLDLLSFSELGEKVCGLISVLGGSGSSNALNHMRLTLRAVHAWVIPHQAAIPQAYKAFDEGGRLVDGKLHDRVARVGSDVAKYCHRLRPPLESMRETGEAT